MITSTVRLDPSVAVLPRRDGTVQLGWHPETSVVVTPPPGVPPDVLLELLRLLAAGHSRPHIVCHALTLGLQPEKVASMLVELDAAGLLTRAHGPLEAGTDLARVETVHIVGRGPLSDALEAGLQRTRAIVSSAAVTPTRYPHGAVRNWEYDVVVLTDDLVTDPRLVTDLVHARIRHLQVRLRDGKGIVGPYVVPGETSCLRCADLTRCELDPEWPHLSAQLLGTVGHAGGATVLATAALALAQIERLLAHPVSVLPETADCTVELEFGATGTSVHKRRWAKHHQCDCWY